MATRDSITGVWDFHMVPRPTAPARLLAGGDLAALLDRPADVERALDRVLGDVDDFDRDPESMLAWTHEASAGGGRHG